MIPTKTLPVWIEALQKDKELPNAEVWKNRQALINALSALVVSVVQLLKLAGVEIPFTDDQLLTTSSIVFLLIFNVWAVLATTKRIGISS